MAAAGPAAVRACYDRFMSNLAWGYLVALGLAIAGIVGFGVGIQQHQVEANLNAHGVRVSGSVRYAQTRERGGTSTRRGNQQDFFLCVEYVVKGARTERWFECTLWALDTHPQGSAVEVIYDPADPSVAMLGGNLTSESSGWMFYGSVMVFALGLLLATYVRITIRQDNGVDDGESGGVEREQPHWSNDPLSEDNPGNIPTQ